MSRGIERGRIPPSRLPSPCRLGGGIGPRRGRHMLMGESLPEGDKELSVADIDGADLG